MGELPYTDKEICCSFSKNPTMQQINILSELNNCNKAEILKIIHSYGLRIVEKNKKIAKPVTENTKPIVKNSFVQKVEKRMAKLEFLSLSFPERQKEWLDEIQELRMLLNDCILQMNI